MDFYGKTIGTRKFVRYIAMSAMEGCPLNGVSLYTYAPRKNKVMRLACQSRVTVNAGAISGRGQYSLVNTIPHHKIITFDIFKEFSMTGDIIH